MHRTPWILAGAIAVMATGCYQDFDFDADHKADRVYVEADGDWIDAASGDVVFDGLPGDIAVPGDYDGDHLWDTGVVRADGTWVTADGTFHHPAPAQLPGFVSSVGSDAYQMFAVPGDYDGDGTDDPAWYRDTDGTWFIEGMDPIVFGSGPTSPPPAPVQVDEVDQDTPVPADYDGDGITDLATFNSRTMVWNVLESSTGTVDSVTMTGNLGLPLPVPADYDGVGHAQRATAGAEGWDIEGHAEMIPLQGDGGYYPAVADYDGDDRADLSYVDDDGNWVTMGSGDVFTAPGLGFSWFPYPLPTGYNLIHSIAHITFVGQCHYRPYESSCS